MNVVQSKPGPFCRLSLPSHALQPATPHPLTSHPGAHSTHIRSSPPCACKLCSSLQQRRRPAGLPLLLRKRLCQAAGCTAAQLAGRVQGRAGTGLLAALLAAAVGAQGLVPLVGTGALVWVPAVEKAAPRRSAALVLAATAKRAAPAEPHPRAGPAARGAERWKPTQLPPAGSQGAEAGSVKPCC